MQESRSSSLFVAIGASAGGVKACKELLQLLPSDTNNSYIIVMHLKPDVESKLAEVLGPCTSMPVREVNKKMAMKPNTIYLISPDTLLEVEGNSLVPRKMPNSVVHYLQKPIDKLFYSLARNKFEKAVGIILSGTGNDGTTGSYEIKYNMGAIIAQTPSTADYPEMPKNLISSGNVDKELTIAQIPDFLQNYAKLIPLRQVKGPIKNSSNENTGSDIDLKKIYTLLGERYHIDLANFYKQGTLLRRSSRRMQLLNIESLTEYSNYLEDHVDESEALYNDLLIGVTKFFRDLHVWKDLEEVTLPKLIQAHKKGTPFRIWVPGCATGEEAYSLAIILNELLTREGRSEQVQIFATDISESALQHARQAIYPQNIAKTVPADKLESYFDKSGDCYKVKREIREQVIFSHHNLLTDPPFTSLDLISCRNLLIYFQHDAQQRVMELFHFALRPTGFLILGTAETVGQKNNLFEIESGLNKIYRPILSNRMRYKHLKNFIIRQGSNFLSPKGFYPGQRPEKSIDQYLEKYILNKHTHSCVAINESFEIYSFYGDTTHFLTPPTGEARMSILSWAKSGIYARLKTALDQAKAHNKKVVVNAIQINHEGNKEFIEFVVEPITPLPGNLKMYLVIFNKSTTHANSTTELESEKTEYVKQIEDELKNTQDELESTISQFKTSLDEYQTNHEELVTLNEELQSNNEEIEASKEELQSLIEELTALNQQNKSKNEELHEVFSDLNNLLISTNIPLIFLDRNGNVRRFTPSIRDILHITDSDFGRPIQEIKEKFEDSSLIADIQEVQHSNKVIKKEIQTEDGRFFTQEILPYKTEDGQVDGTCIAFYDITLQKEAIFELDEQKNFSELIVDTTITGFVLLRDDLTVAMANQAFCDFFQLTKAQVYNQKFFDIEQGILKTSEFHELSQKILNSNIEKKTYVIRSKLKHVGPKEFRIIARKTKIKNKHKIILAIQDVTIQRESKRVLQKRTSELKKEQKRKDEFLAMLSHELRNPLNALINGVTLLEIKSKKDVKSLSVIEMMKRQSGRIVHILDELLEITRISTGKVQLNLKPINFAEAIAEAVEALEHAVEQKQQKIIYSFSPDEQYMVFADKARLVQIAENIINNAIKYTQEGGTIWITLEKDNYHTFLKVKDNGMGIDEELLHRVFDIFVQGKNVSERSQKGLGLGLSLIKNLIEAHNGHISVTSDGLGKGSEFTVELKSYQGGESTREKNIKLTSSAAKQRKKNILLVDDEEDSSRMLQDILASAGFTVQYATNANTALKKFAKLQPDVTIIDMGLPDMDGHSLEKEIQTLFPGHKSHMIALSGHKKDEKKFKQSGFRHYLMKPAKMDELISIINSFS